MIIETERLILRQWKEEDREPYRAYCADPVVRRFFPAVLTAEETDDAIGRMAAGIARDGFGFFVAERKSDGTMLGEVGMSPILDYLDLRGSPRIEIGWLLGKEHWGKGYAPEAARACLAYAWETLDEPEVVAFTASINAPSQRVMEKIGMTRDLDGNFEHPKVPEGSPLRPHVLYRIVNPRS